MDAVICSAVLHFAKDEAHFGRMVEELWRVLAPDGLLFARLASSIGLEQRIGPVAGRQVRLPDGSDRFVVDEAMLLDWTERLGGELADPHQDDQRPAPALHDDVVSAEEGATMIKPSPVRVLTVALALLAAWAATSLAQAPPLPDWTKLEAEILLHYQTLLRLDTSDPPGGSSRSRTT